MKNDAREFKYVKYCKMESPYSGDERIVYHLFIEADELPVGLPIEVNPRDVNTKKQVYKKIVSGLVEENDSFFVNNRGILIAAKGVKIDALNGVVKLDVGDGSENDNSLYGILDGGHTYHAIINNRKDIGKESKQYIHLEIMTNVRNIDELAQARNTSVQVSDKAIAELADKFEFVKDAIKNEPYRNDISYRENEDKPLDSVDLVRLMFAFNIYKYKNESSQQPIAAYNGKASVLKDYLQNYDYNDNPYKKIAKLLPDITKLYDTVEKEMVLGYNEVNKGGKFGSVKGVDSKSYKTKYRKEDGQYVISQGLLFPIVAAFRALIVERDGVLEWEVNPFEVWQHIRGKLVNNTVEMSRSLGNNPSTAGKNSTLWQQNYDAVNAAKLQILLNNIKDNL